MEQDGMRTFHYIVTLEYQKTGGGEIGRFWFIDPWRTSRTGTVKVGPEVSDRGDVVQYLLDLFREEDWKLYREQHSFDELLPEENVLPSPHILLFELHPNEI